MAAHADAMVGDEEEDNNIMLIKMLARAHSPESGFPQRKASTHSEHEESTTPKLKEANINPLYT